MLGTSGLGAHSQGTGLTGRSGMQLGGTQQQTGLGGLGRQQTGLGGLGQMQTGLGGLGQQQTGIGGLGQRTGALNLGLGQQQAGIGLSQQQQGGLKTGLGLNLGQQSGLGQQQTGLNLGLGQRPLLGLGQQQQAGLGLGGGGLQTSGGIGLSSNLVPGTQTSAATGLNLGLGGLGQTQTPGIGLNLGLGQTGLGQPGLGQAGLAQTVPTQTGGVFALPAQQAVAQQMVPALQAGQATPQEMAQLLLSAITLPGIFGDERDVVVKKFNQLQAYCGTGKGLTSYAGQPLAVNFGPEHIFARFKTICYSRLPSARNEDGLVALQFKKTEQELLQQQDSLTKTLQVIVDHPMVQVKLDSVRPLPDNCAEVIVYILELSAMGHLQRVQATNTFMHLHAATRKAQLEKLGVIFMYPKTGFSEEELKVYLSTPPLGIPLEVWEQSKKDNPDPQKYIPVPVMSSGDLLKRAKQQQQECSQQEARIKLLLEQICRLRQQQCTAVAKISECQRRLNDFSHRILKVMVAQEKLRKSGWSVQLVEEQLRSKLEAIQVELDSPTRIKGKLNELMSQVRMQAQMTSYHSNSRLSLDSVTSSDLEEHLSQQQKALAEMVKIIQQDFRDLQLIETGLQKMR